MCREVSVRLENEEEVTFDYWEVHFLILDFKIRSEMILQVCIKREREGESGVCDDAEKEEGKDAIWISPASTWADSQLRNSIMPKVTGFESRLA